MQKLHGWHFLYEFSATLPPIFRFSQLSSVRETTVFLWRKQWFLLAKKLLPACGNNVSPLGQQVF
jgi:hypothetical protein